MNSYELAPEVGRWTTFCCHLDLEPIEDEHNVLYILENREDFPVRVWKTKREALEELLSETAHPEEIREINALLANADSTTAS